MRVPIPVLVALCVPTAAAFFHNLDAVGTRPWWVAVAGGVVLGMTHFLVRSSGVVFFFAAVAMGVASLVWPDLHKRLETAMFAGLSFGLLCAIALGALLQRRDGDGDRPERS